MTTALDSRYLIEQLEQLISNPESLDHEELKRSKIQSLARQASVALETEQESMNRIMFAFVPLVTARISNGFNLFSTLVKADSTNPVSVPDLVKATGLDKYIVRTIMDYHVYAGVAVEPRQGFYAPTRLTNAMIEPKFGHAVTVLHDIVGPAHGALYRFLRDGPEQSGQTTAFQVGQRTTQSYYDWLESHPEQHGALYGFMAATNTVADKWIDSVRFDEEFAQGAKKGEPVFVDVGGGDGLQSIAVQKVHKLGGRIILQDRALVVEKATKAKEAGIEGMVHDFFTENPVKGARVYFMQFVLLNWDNENVVRILAAQAPAMGPKSVLIINDYLHGYRWENEGKPLDPDLFLPAMTLTFRSTFGGLGRSREDWRELLERAGLRLKEVRLFTNFGQALIIATKP